MRFLLRGSFERRLAPGTYSSKNSVSISVALAISVSEGLKDYLGTFLFLRYGKREFTTTLTKWTLNNRQEISSLYLLQDNDAATLCVLFNSIGLKRPPYFLTFMRLFDGSSTHFFGIRRLRSRDQAGLLTFDLRWDSNSRKRAIIQYIPPASIVNTLRTNSTRDLTEFSVEAQNYVSRTNRGASLEKAGKNRVTVEQRKTRYTKEDELLESFELPQAYQFMISIEAVYLLYHTLQILFYLTKSLSNRRLRKVSSLGTLLSAVKSTFLFFSSSYFQSINQLFFSQILRNYLL